MSHQIGMDGPHGRGSVKRIAIMVLAAAAILSVPLIAMQFFPDVNWTGSDFAVFAAMLFVGGTALELGLRLSPSLLYRLAYAAAVGGGFFMVWVALAVGIIGDSGDAADLIYLAVLGAGVAGATVIRGRPRGMAMTMVGVAVVQAVAAGVVLAAGWYQTPGQSITKVLAINGMFAVIWLTSAGLFALAARQDALKG